ncbi:MAG: hypothetical protein COB38_02765 [Gammaproteobacteria bacterium]|nr:MAG: hypothetical protein COB38_02765 [Gammaproteobacteria bacterium]
MNFINKAILGFFFVVIPVVLFFNPFNTKYCGVVFDVESRNLINSITSDIVLKLQKYRSVSQNDICEMPTAYLQKTLGKLESPKPDHPGEAAAFRYQHLLSENKQLNVKNWNAAREQVKNMKANLKKANLNKGAGISSDSWENLGPGNIGGRIRSLAFDPDDSTRIYAGAVAGGVWLTEDSGASWAPTDDFMGNLSVTTVIFDPSDSQVIYAGTGEGTFNADYVRGMGIFRSSDKGQSWSPLDSTQNDFDFYWVNRLTMLNDGSRLVAATHTGVWTSDDDGTSWSRSHVGRSNDINVHPSDDSKLVLGTWGGALYSEDGGLSWSSATGLESITNERVEIAYSASSPDIVYASIYFNMGELYKSTDGGQSYTLVNTGTNYLGQQGWYDNALWVDPFDPDHVIVGGIDLWRSTDAGVSLSKISIWWQSPNSAHADHHFIIEDPDYDGVNNQRVYFANDGGVYVTEDVSIAVGSTGWQELNNQLSITQFYGMGVSPNGTVVAGTQDNGTLVYKGDSEDWVETFGGDGGFSAADPTDSDYVYGEYVYLQIHRSTSGGLANSSSYIFDSAMEADGPLFIAPFILDPNNENRMLGGAMSLWVSDDVKAGTPSWGSKKDSIGSASPINSIAVAPGNSDLVYVGHRDGSLYKSEDATADVPNWTLIDDANLPQRRLLRITIDANNNDIVYLAFSGYEANNLWKSSDAGDSWSSSVGTAPTNIPPAPIRTMVIRPSDSNQLYVGTEVGIFTSDDAGASWGLANDGPANVSVDELVWAGDETLYAATHGRGVYRATLNQTTPNTIIFDSQLDVAFSTVLETQEKIISGIGIPVDVTIVGGEYSLGCDGIYTSDAGIANLDDTICLRHTSADDFYLETLTQVTIGSSTFDFLSKTIPDVNPDAFEFTSTIDVDLASEQISNTVSVTGISFEVDISIVNGEYSIGCTNTFVSSSGVIALDDTVCIRHNASDAHFISVTTDLTLGDTTQSFTSTTLPDTTPEDFSFATQDEIRIGTDVTSDTITLTGFQVDIPIGVSNGEYSIGCTNSFTSTAGVVSPDETVCLKHNASNQYVTETTTTLNVNGVTADFVSTTEPDRTPDDFTFASVSNVELSILQISETITVTGIAVEVNLSVAGGEYSLGCNGTFSSSTVQISEGQTICLRHITSSGFSANVTTSMTVGTYTTSFVSTTKVAPPSESSGGGSLPKLIIFSLIFGVFIRRVIGQVL